MTFSSFVLTPPVSLLWKTSLVDEYLLLLKYRRKKLSCKRILTIGKEAHLFMKPAMIPRFS